MPFQNKIEAHQYESKSNEGKRDLLEHSGSGLADIIYFRMEKRTVSGNSVRLLSMIQVGICQIFEMDNISDRDSIDSENTISCNEARILCGAVIEIFEKYQVTVANPVIRRPCKILKTKEVKESDHQGNSYQNASKKSGHLIPPLKPDPRKSFSHKEVIMSI